MEAVRPPTQYVRTPDGAHLAYQLLGEGPVDLVFIGSWFGNVEIRWEYPPFARFVLRMSSFSRVLLFDKRGTGASDPMPQSLTPTMEDWADDLERVMDAVGMHAAALWTVADAGPVGMWFAATRPERTRALILANTAARLLAAPDYPMGLHPDVFSPELVEQEWGRDSSAVVAALAPSKAHDGEFRRWYARYQRSSGSPGMARAVYSMLSELDMRTLLPAISTPTLVLHRTSCLVSVENGRYLTERIQASRLVELPGADVLTYLGDQDALLDEVEQFLTGVRRSESGSMSVKTLLFTDITASTSRNVQLGDRSWRTLLAEHDAMVRGVAERFDGDVVKTTGDGALVTFDGAARAVRCAVAIRQRTQALGLDVRAALHAGEVERTTGDVSGVAVHIAHRVLEHAGPGEVLVSRTVADLIIASGIVLCDRGEHELRGIPGVWRLHAVEQA